MNELSRREQEVLALVAAGRRNREIAEALCISEMTVEFHIRRILKKLGARSRTEAAVRALHQGLYAPAESPKN